MLVRREVELTEAFRKELESRRVSRLRRWLFPRSAAEDSVEKDLVAGMAEEYTATVEHFAAGEGAGVPARFLECEPGKIMLLFWQGPPPMEDLEDDEWYREFVIVRSARSEAVLEGERSGRIA